jgi:hypothetical protein
MGGEEINRKTRSSKLLSLGGKGALGRVSFPFGNKARYGVNSSLRNLYAGQRTGNEKSKGKGSPWLLPYPSLSQTWWKAEAALHVFPCTDLPSMDGCHLGVLFRCSPDSKNHRESSSHHPYHFNFCELL